MGMIVAAFAIGYWLLTRDPALNGAFVWVGLLGNVYGPTGFLGAAIQAQVPWAFGINILATELV